jgi:Kef-type K+ transport system membrane component KefB
MKEQGWKRRMSVRVRKLIGAILLFVLIAAWALLAMALAQSVLASANAWLALLYYTAAGLGWVLPAMPLIRWMQRPDRAAE